MAAGIIKAVKFTMLDPEGALKLFLRQVPETALSATGADGVRLGIGIFNVGMLRAAARDNGIGYTVPQDYESMTDLVMHYAASPGDTRPDVAATFTNDFVGAVRCTPEEWAKAEAAAAPFQQYLELRPVRPSGGLPWHKPCLYSKLFSSRKRIFMASLSRRSVALGAIASPFLSLSGAHGQAKRKVSFTLSWVADGSNAYAYVARELGFWDELGLDVQVSRGYGSVAAAQAVGAGAVPVRLGRGLGRHPAGGEGPAAHLACGLRLRCDDGRLHARQQYGDQDGRRISTAARWPARRRRANIRFCRCSRKRRGSTSRASTSIRRIRTSVSAC